MPERYLSGGYMDISDQDGRPNGRVVLCGANSYEEKFYFNPKFYKLPESVKEELQIICVLYTEEVGGIFMILFEEDGSVSFDTSADENDYLYDEVGAALLMSEIRKKRQDLLRSLSLYYRSVFLHEDVSGELDED